MANSGLFIGWTEPKSGREKIAADLFAATVAYYTSKVQDGTVESFEPVFLAHHGGDLNGFFLLRGQAEKLDALRHSPEFKDWTVKAVHCLNGFGVIEAYLGDALQDMMRRWAAAIPR